MTRVKRDLGGLAMQQVVGIGCCRFARLSAGCVPLNYLSGRKSGSKASAPKASVCKILASGGPNALRNCRFLRARGCLRLLLSACNAAAAPPKRSGRRLLAAAIP